MNIKELKKEAKELNNKGDFAMRSCWNCNGSHEGLKKADYLFVCFECGHWFYKGIDVTED